MNAYGTWSRGDFKAVIRRELMDPTLGTGSDGRWFKDSELNLYLDEWLQDLQQEFEFVWGISTLTVGTVTSVDGTTPPQLIIPTSTFQPGMLRNEAVYYNGFRLAGRLLQDLEVGDPLWRGDLGNGAPPVFGSNVYDTPRLAVMYPDSQHILIWPTPPAPVGTITNQFIFEYPVLLTFASDQSRSGLPMWTQWSAKPFVCQKLFQRPGPINDMKKSLRYKAQYVRAKERVRRIWDGFLPERYRVLKPAQHYEWEILTPPPAWGIGTNTASGVDLSFETILLPSDAGQIINLPVFFPVNSLALYRNGLLQTDGVDFTRIGQVLTLLFTPVPTDTLTAVIT